MRRASCQGRDSAPRKKYDGLLCEWLRERSEQGKGQQLTVERTAQLRVTATLFAIGCGLVFFVLLPGLLSQRMAQRMRDAALLPQQEQECNYE